MDKSVTALKAVQEWWTSLTPIPQNNNLPAKGNLTGALVILERLKDVYSLNIDAHRAKQGQSQIEGAGKAATKRILARYGETRPFTSEGGRTNRGLAGAMAHLLAALEPLKLEALPSDTRNSMLAEMQAFLVSKISDYFNRERVKFDFDPSVSTWKSIDNVLTEARNVGKEGQVAQYLIGAKLSLRFPDITVRNDLYSTSDIQHGEHGDFVVNNTVFHVTIAPNNGHFQKCDANIREGYRVYLLVPERVLLGAKQNAGLIRAGKIAVQSIESFIAQNIEELSVFASDKIIEGFKRLLDKYNERVDGIESDKSMLIAIPRNLVT